MSRPSLPNPTTLFVAWQDPRSRGYFPIGRLRTLDGGREYEFRYTHGIDHAAQAGFRPLIGLDDPLGIYRSSELFPVFANRVPSRKRIDRREYIETFDLDPDTAEPFQILAISGGRRVTDTLEVIPAPRLDGETNTFATTIFVHGLRHFPREAQERVLRLKPGDQLFVMLDVQNPFDHDAIALRTADNGPERFMVGYLPRYIRSDAWKLFAGCGGPHSSIDVHVRRVNAPPAPLDQRLLCDVTACWPEGFTPFDGREYRVIEPGRTPIRPLAASLLERNGAAEAR